MAGVVMIVEDDEDVRENLGYLIEARGYRVETAANGQEALDKLNQFAPGDRPSLLVVDLMMPVMDGWELRRHLLADPLYADMAVIVLSGVADLQDQARALQVVAYLTKPFDLEKLFGLVERYCTPAPGTA